MKREERERGKERERERARYGESEKGRVVEQRGVNGEQRHDR
jgi:hypothetical protein